MNNSSDFVHRRNAQLTARISVSTRKLITRNNSVFLHFFRLSSGMFYKFKIWFPTQECQSSHSRKCTGGVIAQFQTSNPPPNTNHMSINDQPAVTLPTFEEVCQLNLPTLRFIPSEVKTCLCLGTVNGFEVCQ